MSETRGGINLRSTPYGWEARSDFGGVGVGLGRSADPALTLLQLAKMLDATAASALPDAADKLREQARVARAWAKELQ